MSKLRKPSLIHGDKQFFSLFLQGWMGGQPDRQLNALCLEAPVFDRGDTEIRYTHYLGFRSLNQSHPSKLCRGKPCFALHGPLLLNPKEEAWVFDCTLIGWASSRVSGWSWVQLPQSPRKWGTKGHLKEFWRKRIPDGNTLVYYLMNGSLRRLS